MSKLKSLKESSLENNDKNKRINEGNNQINSLIINFNLLISQYRI